MSDREISWGDEDSTEQPQQRTPEPAGACLDANGESINGASWSLDTRGDGPRRSNSPRNDSRSYNEPENYASFSGQSGYEQGGYEQTSSYERPGRGNGSSSASRMDRPANGRRPGRDPVERVPRAEGSKGRDWNDLSTLNLPGVDLSKLPQATTRISFDNGGGSRGRRGDNDGRRSDFRQESSYGRDGNDGWAQERDESAAFAAPVAAANNRDDGEVSWGDEPAFTPAAEAVTYSPPRSVEPEKAKPVYAEPPRRIQQRPAVVDDRDIGWGDETDFEEPVQQDPKVENVTQALKSSTIEPSPAPAPVSVQVPASEPVPEPISASSVSPVAPVAAVAPIASGPRSPIMAAPNTVLPSSSSWVTCPFCHNCYVHPPVPVQVAK